MKRIIIAAVVIGSIFACKKSTPPKTDSLVKYYFKIQPVEMDDTKNTTTIYKTVNVN